MRIKDHEHSWGPVTLARLTGNPHRRCEDPECDFITLDLTDDEDELEQEEQE